MSDYTPVTGEALSFFDRAKKAVAAAVTTTVGTFASAVVVLASVGTLGPDDFFKAAVAAVTVGLGTLGVTYKAPANKVSPGQGRGF